MNTTRRSLAALASLMTLGVACTTDDTEQSAPDTTLSRDSWTTTVNDLCVSHNEALGAIIGPLFAQGAPSDDDAQAVLDEIVRRTRAVTDEIDALAEPSALTIHVAALVSALEAGSDQAETMGGPTFFAQQETDPFRPAANIAGELGLDACATEA